ncbi:MAG: tyrosine-protein phosphatase [Sphingomonadaceae bacterium]
MIDNRVLALEGIHNFRDYGGYAVSGGGTLCEGVLFRSGQHIAATADDLATVDGLALTSVVDLRGESERRIWPCARGAGFAAEVFFAEGETAGAGGAAHAVAARDVRTAEDAHAAMLDLYAFMPLRPNLQAALRHYFTALAKRPGASLVHCFAGKDRTGLAVALLHRLLGVHRDDMMDDYLLTNTAGHGDRRIAAGAEAIRRSRPQASDQAIRVLMKVHPAWLDAAMTTIDRETGGADAYLETALGLDRGVRDTLVARFVV